MLRLGGKGVTVTINRRSEMGRSHRINSWTTVDVEYIVFYFYFIFPFSPGTDRWYWVSESGPCGTPNDQFYFLFSHFRFFVSSVLILNPRFCSSDLISKHKSKEENKKRGFWEIQAVWPTTFLPYPVYKAGKGERSKMLQGRGYPSSLPTGEFYSFIFRGPDRDVAAAFRAWVITLAFLRVRIADDPRHPWLWDTCRIPETSISCHGIIDLLDMTWKCHLEVTEARTITTAP